MMNWLFGRKKLEDVLHATKKVTLCGVVFTIRKVNMLDYLAGAQVLVQSYDTYKTPGEKNAALKTPGADAKIRRHYADILVAGVVDPELVHEKKDPSDKRVCVEDMFPNWELVDSLYNEIMFFTYGKKKLKQAISTANALSKSIK